MRELALPLALALARVQDRQRAGDLLARVQHRQQAQEPAQAQQEPARVQE